MHRPVHGLTLAAIHELDLPTLASVSLRELVAIIEVEGVEPVNKDGRTKRDRSPKRYSLPSVERAVRRYQRATADTT